MTYDQAAQLVNDIHNITWQLVVFAGLIGLIAGWLGIIMVTLMIRR